MHKKIPDQPGFFYCCLFVYGCVVKPLITWQPEYLCFWQA